MTDRTSQLSIFEFPLAEADVDVREAQAKADLPSLSERRLNGTTHTTSVDREETGAGQGLNPSAFSTLDGLETRQAPRPIEAESPSGDNEPSSPSADRFLSLGDRQETHCRPEQGDDDRANLTKAPPSPARGLRRGGRARVADEVLLAWVCRFSFVTPAQLAAWFEQDVEWARKRVQSRRELGLLESARWLPAGGSAVWAGRRGLRLADWPVRKPPSRSGPLEHVVVQVDVISALERLALSGARVLSELELRRVGLEWRVGGAARGAQFPDAVVETGAGAVAVEVELTRKSTQRLDRHLSFLRAPGCPFVGVVYVAPDPVAAAVEAAAGRVGVGPRVRVVRWDGDARSLPSLVESFSLGGFPARQEDARVFPWDVEAAARRAAQA